MNIVAIFWLFLVEFGPIVYNIDPIRLNVKILANFEPPKQSLWKKYVLSLYDDSDEE